MHSPAALRSAHRPAWPHVFLVALVGLFISASALLAQVEYVRDLSFPSGPPADPILPLTKAPIDTADPLYDPSWAPAGGSEVLFTTDGFYHFDPATGVVNSRVEWPLALRTSADSLVTLTGVGTTEPVADLF